MGEVERFNALAGKLGLSSRADPNGRMQGNLLDMFEELATRIMRLEARVKKLEGELWTINTKRSRDTEI